MNKNLTSQPGSLFKKPATKVTCCDCVKSLQLVVDGEATKEQEEHLMNHVKECLPCYNSYNLEKSVKSLLQIKLEKKPCPQHLIDDIRSKLK